MLNKKFNPMLSKVTYLLRYIKINDNDNFEKLKKAFNNFSSWDKVTQDIFIESLLKTYTSQHNQEYGYWGYDLIDKINPKNMRVNVFDFIRILERINQENQSWSVKKYGSYFRDQIKTSQEIMPEIAYETIKRFYKLLKEHVEDNETERQMVSELVAIIPPMKYYENKLEDEDFNNKISRLQKDILRDALDVQYKIQGNSVVDEWSDAWININPKIKVEELDALRSLQVLSPKAVNFVGYLYEKSESWRADFAYSLRNIRDGNILDKAIMQKEMKAEAEKICQRLGL